MSKTSQGIMSGPFLPEAPAQRAILAGILLLGFCLRVFNIDWGVPVFDELAGRYHPDEWKISVAAIQFPQFIWSNTDFRYPTFFHLLNAVLFQPFRVIFVMFSDASIDELRAYSTLQARAISVFLGTATIYICYRIGSRVLSANAGIVAAIICCVSTYHVVNSAYSTNDVLTSFFLALLLYQIVGLYAERVATRQYLIVGAVFGLLIGTKYNGAAAAILIISAYAWRLGYLSKLESATSFRDAATAITKRYLLMAGITIATFVVTTPGLLVKFSAFTASIRASQSAQAMHAMTGSTTEILSSGIYTYLIACGPLVAVLFFLSVPVLLFKFRFRDWRLYFLASGIVLVLAYSVFFGASLKARYIITLAPIISMSIAAAWHYIVVDGRLWVKRATNLTLAICVLVSLIYTGFGVYARAGDTRTLAAHYLADNIPHGTAIGVSYVAEEYRDTHPWRHPVINFADTFKEADILTNPDVIVVSSYDLDPIQSALESPYLSSDLQWDMEGPAVWYFAAPPGPRIFKFYKDLLSENSQYELLAEFSKIDVVRISFPDPIVRIYRRTDAKM